MIQFLVILILAASLVSEYFHNVYYQEYINSIFPTLITVLSVGFGITSATIAIKLYLGVQKVRALRDEADQGRKKSQSRRSKRAAPAPNLPSSPPASTKSTATTPLSPATVSGPKTPKSSEGSTLATREKGPEAEQEKTPLEP